MKRHVLIALCLLLSGLQAAQAGLFSDDEAHKKIADLQTQLGQVQGQLQGKLDEELKQRQALDGRVTSVETQLKSQNLIDLLNQIEQIKGEVAKLKGQLEVVMHDVEVTQKRQRDLYTDLDTRLRKLEATPASALPAASSSTPPSPSNALAATAATVAPTPPVAPAETVAKAAVVIPSTAPAADAAVELKDYEAAHVLFKTGKYSAAAESFEKFIETYPESKYAPSAQYWLGYSHFSQKNYKSAIAAQQKLLQHYPEHQKAADALYNIANSQIQLSDIDGARKSLKNLIAQYPLSDTAPLAKKRLAALDSLKSRN